MPTRHVEYLCVIVSDCFSSTHSRYIAFSLFALAHRWEISREAAVMDGRIESIRCFVKSCKKMENFYWKFTETRACQLILGKSSWRIAKSAVFPFVFDFWDIFSWVAQFHDKNNAHIRLPCGAEMMFFSFSSFLAFNSHSRVSSSRSSPVFYFAESLSHQREGS